MIFLAIMVAILGACLIVQEMDRRHLSDELQYTRNLLDNVSNLYKISETDRLDYLGAYRKYFDKHTKATAKIAELTKKNDILVKENGRLRDILGGKDE